MYVYDKKKKKERKFIQGIYKLAQKCNKNRLCLRPLWET